MCLVVLSACLEILHYTTHRRITVIIILYVLNILIDICLELMATATVSIDQDNLIEENAREVREILAHSFTEARRRLDEREAQLSLQLEEKINEIKIHNKSSITDRRQLKSVLELMQSSLSSNTLQETGNEAVKPIIEKIDKLERE